MKERFACPSYKDKDISNEPFILGENISGKKKKKKLKQKMLKTLPYRFAYKVAAIGEAKNLKELIRSLHTFKMELEEDKKQRKIAVDFQVEP